MRLVGLHGAKPGKPCLKATGSLNLTLWCTCAAVLPTKKVCTPLPRCKTAHAFALPLWFFPKGRFAFAPMVPDNVRTHCQCQKSAICKTAIWHHLIEKRDEAAVIRHELGEARSPPPPKPALVDLYLLRVRSLGQKNLRPPTAAGLVKVFLEKFCTGSVQTIFAVNCCCLPLSFRRSREKRRKRGKMRRKRGKIA